jgi:hypothetical protein
LFPWFKVNITILSNYCALSSLRCCSA